MTKVLEIFYLQFSISTVLYSTYKIPAPSDEIDPDEAVDLHARERLLGREPWFRHSTSWRWEGPDMDIRTYFVYCEHMLPALDYLRLSDLDWLDFSFGGGHEKPLRRVFRMEDVLAHTIRHLAFLVQQGAVRGDLDFFRRYMSESTIETLMSIPPVVAGRI